MADNIDNRLEMVLPLSLLIHLIIWVYVILLTRQLHVGLVSATYGWLQPSIFYGLIIVIGHGLSFWWRTKQPRLVLVLLILMVYIALVLLITLIRLNNLSYDA